MSNNSLWTDVCKRSQSYPELQENLEVDILIIGAGITGITAAEELIKSGHKVALVDAYQVGGVTTGFSTGNLYVITQPFYQSIQEKFDFETAKAIAYSRQFAIDYIEKTSLEYQINCQFMRRPWYAFTNNNSKISLSNETELLKKMGLNIDYVSSLPLNLPFKKAVTMPNQARFNPLQYVLSMADNLSTRGCKIFENTRVLSIEENNECVVKTERAIIKAQKVFIATHVPIGLNVTQAYVAPYRSYVVAVTLQDKHYPEGNFWNLDNIAHALSTQPMLSNKPELLIAAGAHHKTGNGHNMKAHYAALTSFLKQNFPVSEIKYQWSAQHYHSADNVPYIGLANRSTSRIYMATGFFADGLVYGTLAGHIVGNLLSNQETPLKEIYNSQRHKLLASSKFLMKENLNVFLHYLKDYPLFTDNSFSNLEKGQGKVIEIKREKWAVSRDSNNKLHIVSAVCPHMKCIVNWNNAERTWDCPCHGSRFTPSGKVIEGPATSNLAPGKKI